MVTDIVERLRERAHEFDEYAWHSDIELEAADEIERLRKQLHYQEHRDGRVGTHDSVCYAYGSSHYECALREIERLQEALAALKEGE